MWVGKPKRSAGNAIPYPDHASFFVALLALAEEPAAAEAGDAQVHPQGKRFRTANHCTYGQRTRRALDHATLGL